MIERTINGRYDRLLWSDLTGLRFTQVGTDVLILGRGDKTYLATTLLPQNRRYHLSAHTLDRPSRLRRCHRAAHSTVPMTSVQRFDQLKEGIAVRRSLGGSAASPLAIQPEAASSAASPRFTMSSVLNRMPSAVSRDFGCASQQKLESHAEVLELLSHRVVHDGARFNIRLNGDSLHVPAGRFGFFTQRRTHPRKGAGFCK